MLLSSMWRTVVGAPEPYLFIYTWYIQLYTNKYVRILGARRREATRGCFRVPTGQDH